MGWGVAHWSGTYLALGLTPSTMEKSRGWGHKAVTFVKCLLHTWDDHDPMYWVIWLLQQPCEVGTFYKQGNVTQRGLGSGLRPHNQAGRPALETTGQAVQKGNKTAPCRLHPRAPLGLLLPILGERRSFYDRCLVTSQFGPLLWGS